MDRTLAIAVDRIGKRFLVGEQRSGYDTLRDQIAGWWRRPSGRDRREFWALRDISFDVPIGDVIGIVGRNGAGKTTLLKILSRVTEPTLGAADIRGRVGSLLEVGSGFHPELTGRENIQLNAAILGMRRQEVARRFDEIVAFAEVERFLDTPVKFYSSGMYLRLAFSVAAHLDAEVLLVDEVLAVGDAAFQRKCLAKMHEVGRGGRTVIFVSHNLGAVSRLCDWCVWLDRGEVKRIGPAAEIVRAYLRGDGESTAEQTWPDDSLAMRGTPVRLTRVVAIGESGDPAPVCDITRPIDVRVEYAVDTPTAVNVQLQLFNEEGVHILTSADLADAGDDAGPRPIGRYGAVCRLPGNFLAEGRHLVSVRLTDPSLKTKRTYAAADYAIGFDVFDPMDGSSVKGTATRMTWPGIVRPRLAWRTEVCQPGLVGANGVT